MCSDHPQIAHGFFVSRFGRRPVIFVCTLMGWSVPAMLECCNQGGSHERLVFIGPELAAVDVAALERAERSFDKTI